MSAGTSPLSHAQRRILQLTFASGSPVLVLGPGCSRIGYDSYRRDDDPWNEVTRRTRLVFAKLEVPEHQLFAKRLWWAKLSEETQATETFDNLDPKLRIDLPADSTDKLIDDLRTAMAFGLVTTLIHCTKMLGELVARGDRPVASWTTVNDAAADGDLASDELTRAAAIAALGKVANITAALNSVMNGVRDDEARGWLEAIAPELTTDGDDSNLSGASSAVNRIGPLMKAMNIGAIAEGSRFLTTQCLDSRQIPLSGAVIEWLGDLSWHVLTCDSAVPPSQADLAFLVNLRDDRAEARTFTRPRPGEYRGGSGGGDGVESALDEETRRNDVVARLRERLRAHCNGLEEPEWLYPVRDVRVTFTRTMAAALIAKAGSSTRATRPIALVSSYDMLLERQLFDLLEVGKTFHVIVPVRSSRGDERKLQWLFGTYTKPNEDWSRDLLQSTKGGALRWDWYVPDASERAHDPVSITGPVVIKVNGSPLHRLASKDDDEMITATELGLPDLGDQEHDDGAERLPTELHLATIFSEYETLDSMLALTDKAGQPGTNAGEPRESTIAALNWQTRDWIFFGDSFPDWIPRLRLLLTAKTTSARGGKKPRQLGTRIAIDRSFHWTELAVLEALQVRAFRTDLANIARFTEAHAENEAVQKFFNTVVRIANRA